MRLQSLSDVIPASLSFDFVWLLNFDLSLSCNPVSRIFSIDFAKALISLVDKITYMPTAIKVPSVGESVTSGLLGRWVKKTGDFVRSGETVAEIETDKVTAEVPAEVDGVIKTLVEEGTTVEVGQIIAELEPSEAGQQAVPSVSAPASKQNTETSMSGSNGAPVDVSASPAARFLMEQNKIPADAIEGTGKGGRITKEDVLNHMQSVPKTTELSAPVVEKTVKKETQQGARFTRKPMSPLRQRIAQRLTSAQHEAAILTTFNEVDMSNVMALRARFQDRFVEKHGVKLGFMSFFVKASIYALQQVPALNAQIDGNDIIQNHFYDIGIAISTPKGLLVPVLRDADQLSLAEIEKAIADYAKKAREGKITLQDLEGGVFTITNGGTFGSMLSTPIINPPQSGILGMHAITERPVAVAGRVEVRPIMYVALSYDHRIVDGREAVTFLVRIKEFIEQPALAMLGI